MNPASLAVDAVKVARGRESVSELAGYIMVALTVDAVITRYKESGVMFESIIIPAGHEIEVFIIAVFSAIFIPLVVGMYFLNESKHAREHWTARYVSTMLIDMIITPVVGLITMSALASKYFVDIDALTYEVYLFIVMLIVGYFGLKFLNEGIKAVVEQIRGVKSEIDELK